MISGLIKKLIEDVKQKTTPNEGGFDFLTGGGVAPNIPAQQLGPVLSPDDFGSYVIPASDPTYSSGFDYARSIAGGIPMSQVIAPGVSYSPEQPMGYTQEQLNTAVGTTPVEPPQKLPGPGEEGYGQGIGGLTIFDEIFDIKRKPPRDLPPGIKSMFGGDPRDLPIPLSSLPRFNQAEMAKNIARTMRESGMDFTNLFGMPKFDIPTVDKGVGIDTLPPLPPKRDDQLFIDERMIDRGYGPGIMPPLPPIDIEDIIRKPGVTTIEEAMEIPKRNNQLFIDDRPVIDERILIPPTLPPVDIPPVDIPFIPFIKPPSIMDRPLIMDTPTIMDRPTGGRFSIEQKRPMGLF